MAIVTQQTETNRIQQHLHTVEQQLRAKQPSLPPDQLEARCRNLDRLHEYWVQGEFPRNVTHPHQPIPCFIDPDGRSCAVAHLLLATGNASLAHQIAAVANNALLPAMSFSKLTDWVARSGLTLAELSLIQPQYYWHRYCFFNPETTGHQEPPRIRPVSKVQRISVAARGGLIALAPDPGLTSLALPTFLVYVHGQLEAKAVGAPAGSGEPMTTAEFALMRREYPAPPGKPMVADGTRLYPVGGGSTAPRVLAWREPSSTLDKQNALGWGCLYAVSITLPREPAILCLSLPALDNIQGLEHGIYYDWQFNVQGDLEGQQERFLSTLVKRVPLKPALQQQLKRATPLEQAELYAKHDLWYDALTIMAEQLRLDSACVAVQKTWQQILQEVGLEHFAAVPLVHCPALIHHHPCPAPVSFKAHQHRIRSANFSPDGQCIITTAEDNTVRLWSLVGTPIRVMTHQQAVYSASFSPDGQLILTTSQHGTIQLWNLAGQQVAKVKHLQQDNTIRSAQFSPDGRYVASISDAETKVWHLSGELLFKLDPQHYGKLRAVSFSADIYALIIASAAAQPWNLSDLLAKFHAGQQKVFGVSDKYVFTSGKEAVQVWTFSGECVAELKGHFAAERSIKLSPDGKHIMTTSGDGAAQVWHFSGALMAELKGNSPLVCLASFSPDSKSIVTASGDRAVRIWSLTGKLLKTFGHPTGIMSADFSPDGQHILTVCDDPIVRLWTLS